LNPYQIGRLDNLMVPRQSKRKRISSYDRSGGNDDRIYIRPGETKVIADIQTKGVITHIWMTSSNQGFKTEAHALRKALFMCHWDDEKDPSVLVPLGDFFGMGHALTKNFVSAPLQMSPEDGKGFNSWWVMPFEKSAVLSVKNECDTDLILYFYIDYEEVPAFATDILTFHASWHREMPTKGKDPKSFPSHEAWCFEGDNVTGDENYVILDAKGKGHFVGCHIDIHNFSKSEKWDWPGEGDDMIFIDGEPWPPNIHGTGTEDYVNMAWCPRQTYSAPYHGLILGGDENWKGKITYYRYHIQDPITFEKSIKVTIEHGHNNNRSDDWSSTAYWYQTEPHEKLVIKDVKERIPLDDDENV
jgi:hypothetical protein